MIESPRAMSSVCSYPTEAYGHLTKAQLTWDGCEYLERLRGSVFLPKGQESLT